MRAVLDKIEESLEGEVTLVPRDRDASTWIIGGRMVGFVERRESLRVHYASLRCHRRPIDFWGFNRSIPPGAYRLFDGLR